MPDYPCTTCGLGFPSEEALLAHVGSAHTETDALSVELGKKQARLTTIDFPEQLVESTKRTYAAWSEAQNLSEEEKKSKFRRAVRVNARYTTELRKELRSGERVWYSDASESVGGKGEHPGALQHFVAGLPLCQLTHYAERASVAGIKLEGLEISAIGHYVAISGYPFDSIEYEVRIASVESENRIAELAASAAEDCYVTNTMRQSCRVSGKVFLNGDHILDL